MGSPLRVLLVEDSEADAELLLRELARNGYDVASRRVQTAHDMRQALSAEAWELVISDFSMPDFDALRALKVLQESGVEIPFIIISGTIGEETAVAALQAGAGDFLLKGRLARLKPAIERELREHAVRVARRLAERALRESEARYRRIIETANDGVWMLDAAGTTTFVNRHMATMLEHSPEELKGRSFAELLHADSRREATRQFGPLHDAAGQIELRFVRKSGSDLWALVGNTPITDEHGAHEGALAMVMDITQRKRLEEQLRQAQKMEAIGSLAGGVAHDFNNLLSVILSYTSMVLGSLKAGDPMRGDLDEVLKAGHRAGDLTRQLLAFSRKQMLEPGPLDLSQIVAGMERMMQRLLGEDLELSFLTSKDLGIVLADRGQVEQIIMNLVVNARDAMPRGGKVTIETINVELGAEYASAHHEVTPGPYVLLAVSDTGIGMDAATQARMFEPFFTTKEQGRGTGLGLSTVFGIVKQSGGHIWVYSEPGNGTTFKIYFPRLDGPLGTETQPPGTRTTLVGTETVLLVEDEEQVRLAMRAILRRQGYNVLEAQNGGEAFLICEKYTAKIHLLLTDVVMPRMSGRELAERLAPMRPAMKVLFVSGYTDNAIVHHGVLDAGVSFLQKPITPEALARKVREVLDSGRT